MKKVINVVIERAKDGIYTAYMPEQSLNFGAIGEGKTTQEAKQDFINVINAYVADGEVLPAGTEFQFSYDIPSFLSYYNQFLTLVGMQKITGVNKAQLSHYLTGHRKPSAKTAQKIAKNIHTFGKELTLLEFA